MPAYTAKDLAESALPALVVGEYKTKSTAIQNSQFKRTLGYWSGFEAEVRKLVKKQEWPEEELVHYPDSHRGDAEYYEDEDDTESTFEDEIYACGDEQSVVGRFANNVGHVMGHVYTALGKPLRFSDWKGSPNSAAITQSQSMKIPDFAIWDPRSGQSTLLVIGEAKTPWKHSIKAAMTTEAKTRQYFGQIADYMFMTSCKYGFLTTYNETVFLKQEPHPNHEGEFVLWHSNIIHHNTFFKDVKSKDPLHFHGRVSLRECFLYFAFKAAKEPYTPYPRIRTQWVGRHQDTYSGNFIPEHEGVVPKYAVVPRLPPPPGQTQLVDRTLRSSTARATEREHRPQGLFSHHPASNRSIGTTPDPYPILPEDDTHRGSLYPKGRQEGKPGRLTSPFEPMPMEKKRRTAFEGYDYGRAHRQSQVQQPHMPVTDRRGLATLEIRRGKYYFRSADERLVRVDLEIRTNSRGECERYFVWQDVEYIVKKFREYDDDEF